MLQRLTQTLLNSQLCLDLPLRVAVVNLPFGILRHLMTPDGLYVFVLFMCPTRYRVGGAVWEN